MRDQNVGPDLPFDRVRLVFVQVGSGPCRDLTQLRSNVTTETAALPRVKKIG
jgi:hypothetical protein